MIFFNDEILGKRKYLRDLSKENQKEVGIIGILIGNPKVIILDEPFANLNPATQIRLKRIKEPTENEEVTLLISNYDLLHTVEVSTRIVMFEKGNIVKDIESSVQNSTELESFFGVSS
ncbi:hypothetical protein [Capnocytophaga sp.]|uniref:hypothetical protein n=1 Tax=Capnocytophaga sp. TaxID=44737 RepID=UPI0034C5BE48